MDLQSTFNPAAIAALCKRHHIVRLKLFGSALTDAFNDDSDIDLLATFAPGQTPGWEIIDIERAFAELLGRPVDLLTETSLRPRWRDEVLPTAEVLYAA
ncbi:MAG: nucleotidyltransferase family protein [Phycisphaerales bacterium JB063]